MQNTGALAAVIMNTPASWSGGDELVDMGNADPTMNITIPSVFITNADGQELQRLLKDSPVLLSLNATGETTLRNPTFWDMFLTFLQLSVVLWVSIALLYGCANVAACFQRRHRRQACHSIPTVVFKEVKSELLEWMGEVTRRKREECPICLETFQRDDKVKVLPCGHLFHEKCAASWIVDVRGICPLCRQGVFETTKEVRQRRRSEE